MKMQEWNKANFIQKDFVKMDHSAHMPIKIWIERISQKTESETDIIVLTDTETVSSTIAENQIVLSYIEA